MIGKRPRRRRQVRLACEELESRLAPSVLLGWDESTLPGGTNNFGPSPEAATVVAAGVSNSTGLTRGSGVGTTGNATPRAWGGNTWNPTSAAGGITNNQIVTFGMTVLAGETVSLSDIDLYYLRSTRGPANGQWSYQINGGAFTTLLDTNLFSSTSGSGAHAPLLNLSSTPALQNLPAGTVVNFRLVPYGATRTSGTWYVYDVNNSTGNDLAVDGTVTAVTGTIATTTVLTDNGPNPSVQGSAVSFTVSVTPASGPVINGETVQIEDASNGNAVVATPTLVNGSVSFTISSLLIGTHNLFASYLGDANNQPSQSAQVAQVVSASSAIGLNFSGGSGNTFAPPDTDGAIGPSQYTQFINGRFAVYNKTTGAQVLAETDTAFWNAAGISSTVTGVGLSDTRVVYDPLSGRWFATEINVANTGNQLLVGRSDTSDPSGTWHAVNFTANSGFGDYPTLGVDAQAVIVGLNNFTSGTGFMKSISATTIPKADLLQSTPSAANRTTVEQTNETIGFTPQGVTNFAANPAYSSIVALNTSTGRINRTTVTGTGAAGATFGTTSVLTTQATSAPGDSRQPDGTRQLDGDDLRIPEVVYQVGDLIYTVYGISVNSSGVAVTSGTSTTNAIRITVLRDSTNSVVAEATWFNPNFDYSYPSIIANSFGDIVIGFTRSSGVQGSGASDGNAGAYAVQAYLNPNNPTSISFIGGDIQLKAGQVNNYHLFGGSGERWGDFSATNLDPNNPLDFWTTQEYTVSSNTWGTQISQIYVSPRVTNVTSPLANGTYGTGAVAPITVTFSGPVTVSGTPSLALNSGGAASYVSGSGTNTLTFDYTVAAGQIAADLDAAATTALTLGGGSIKDSTSALDAVLTLAPGATGSLGTNKSIVINANSVATIAANTPNPSVFGQGAAFTVTVAAVSPATGTPTGSVKLQDNGVDISGATGTLSGGSVTITVSSFSVGTHANITAVYAGDSNFSGSTSAAVSQTVNKANSVTTVVSNLPNPSLSGESVSFVVTAAAAAPGAGTPTGTVKLQDNGVDIPSASASLAGGSATIAVASLGVGTHANITAVYVGDGSFNGGTSAAVSQTVYTAAMWEGYARDPEHSALSAVASQPLTAIRWQTPVDLQPQYSGNELLIHYGSPSITPANTVIVPIKTGASGGFEVKAFNGTTGAVLWTQTTDYQLPPNPGWTPSYGPVLTPAGRYYFAGDGGTVYYIANPDGAGTVGGQVAFFGNANYTASPAAYNSTVFINTPLTSDNAGDIYFGFQVTGSNPLGLVSGIARIAPDGTATYVSAATAAGNPSNPSVLKVVDNSAPALSNDGRTLYVAVNNGNDGIYNFGYLIAVNSTTLAFQSRALLVDPSTGQDAYLPDDGTASPTVGPDGDVYMGVLENPFPHYNDRGWLLHFTGNLTPKGVPGAFGWDDTVSIVPAAMVASYTGPSSYLLMTKYNNYIGIGTGDGQNKIAILDPNTSENCPVTGSSAMQVMDEVRTVLGPTPVPAGGVAEWCINSAVVDPATDSILAGSEDGKLYRWNLASNTLSQVITLTSGLGEAYTPTLIGADGTVYAINNATLFAVGNLPIAVSSVTVNGSTAPIISATEAGNTITITTDGPHGFAAGDPVAIAGVGSGYDATYTIQTAAANSFTVTSSSTGLPAVTGQGTATDTTQTAGVLANGATPQRSLVDGVVYVFNQPVNIAAGAFTIAVHSGQPGTVPALLWASPDGGTTWVVTFTGSGVVSNSIANGVYDLTLHAAAVHNAANAGLSADSVSTFFRLYGDSNGDERVNISDYSSFVNTFGLRSNQTGFIAAFDVNDDGRINITDYSAFVNDFGTRYSGFTPLTSSSSSAGSPPSGLSGPATGVPFSGAAHVVNSGLTESNTAAPNGIGGSQVTHQGSGAAASSLEFVEGFAVAAQTDTNGITDPPNEIFPASTGSATASLVPASLNNDSTPVSYHSSAYVAAFDYNRDGVVNNAEFSNRYHTTYQF